ncbi:MAG TPA: helix-turn-helix domain-containing protein [Allosphingosinicella sp.]|nr:helix-turn-helix domain-containing protein [Allosphingosinicella sp.]
MTRTRAALAHALLRLSGTIGLEALTVADLVREAGISRSTFYAHFTGKADFVSRSFAGMIQLCALHDAAGHLLPSRPLALHMAGQRAFSEAFARWAEFQLVLRAGEVQLRRIALANLAARRPDLAPGDREAAAAFLAGGLMGLLKSWIESGLGSPPERIHARYLWLESGLLAALSPARLPA